MKKAVIYSLMGDTDFHVLSAMSVHSLIDNNKSADIDIILLLDDMSYAPIFSVFGSRVKCEPMPRLSIIPDYLQLDFIKKHVDLDNRIYNGLFRKEHLDEDYTKYMNNYYLSCDAQLLGGIDRVDKYDRILCLDIDTIINDDVDKLFNYDMGHYYKEYSGVFAARPTFFNQADSDMIFNAGVILINCIEYRRAAANNEFPIFYDWYKERSHKDYQDYRYIRYPNWGEYYLASLMRFAKMYSLPRIWNNYPLEEERYYEFTKEQRMHFRHFLSGSKILHYTACSKPWGTFDDRREHELLMPHKNWLQYYFRYSHKYPSLSSHHIFNIKRNMRIESQLDKGVDIGDIL